MSFYPPPGGIAQLHTDGLIEGNNGYFEFRLRYGTIDSLCGQILSANGLNRSKLPGLGRSNGKAARNASKGIRLHEKRIGKLSLEH